MQTLYGRFNDDRAQESSLRGGIRHSHSPLALVKRAVRTEGFIGVKLYPPMGFLPLDNAIKLDYGDFPDHLELPFRKQLNAALDAVLGDLYAWCVEEQVPILAHAANSNGAGEGYSLRASPDNWAAVAKNFSGIRISLAHFGRFDAGFASPANPHPRLDQTWEWKMAKLVRAYPGSKIYIDLSYLRAALLAPDNNIRSEVVRMLGEVKKEFPAISDRMLFGTDWVMFGEEELFPPISYNGQYADRVVQLFTSATFTEPEVTRIMSANAGSFIGLDLPASTTGNRARLTSLYNASGLDTDWMNEFSL
jgi:predicted TIM-barrel fold metal-dependent hydrolase